MPFKASEVTSLPAPMFHALGFLHATIAMMLGSTLVLRRRFKPATVLADIEKNKVTAIVVVPVMLSRILDELEKTQPKPNLSSLRIVFVSGSQLGAELATRALKDLGPVIYNLYGSTEIAFATIARPKDLSINPGTVGPVVKGVKVKILDENGNELPQGEVGRIFVGNTFPFEGYTGGGHKQIIDGLMSSGDVGYFDEHGLLYVSGRDDEMIVSGGENVFPAEVEDLISGHPEVVEATALGVEDKEWGHRLRCFVVKTEGASIDEDAIKAYVREQPGPLQGAARGDLPRRAAAQPHRQDPQARTPRNGRRRRRRIGRRRRRRRMDAVGGDVRIGCRRRRRRIDPLPLWVEHSVNIDLTGKTALGTGSTQSLLERLIESGEIVNMVTIWRRRRLRRQPGARCGSTVVMSTRSCPRSPGWRRRESTGTPASESAETNRRPARPATPPRPSTRGRS